MAWTSPPDDWTLALCGGGSGGHLFPALAVVEELRRREPPPGRVLFLTAGRPIEQRILDEYDVEHLALASADSSALMQRPWSSLPLLWRSVRETRRMFRERRPRCVVGTGGYGSLPGVLAAWREGIPVVLLEQNVVPGRATALLSRVAERVCASFEETAAALPRPSSCLVTGNPVRESIAQLATRNDELEPRTLLILGGSQGALAINRAMTSILPSFRELLSGWDIIHQTGEQDCDRVRRAYADAGLRARVEPFLSDMTSAYQRASLVVSRAGGTSLAEVACAGLPAILVPYPGAVRDHQILNARWYVDRGAAMMVAQPDSGERLAESLASPLRQLIVEKERRQAMRQAMRSVARPDAARRVADVLEEL